MQSTPITLNHLAHPVPYSFIKQGEVQALVLKRQFIKDVLVFAWEAQLPTVYFLVPLQDAREQAHHAYLSLGVAAMRNALSADASDWVDVGEQCQLIFVGCGRYPSADTIAYVQHLCHPSHIFTLIPAH